MIASEVSSRKEALPRYLSGYGLIEAEVEHCVAALDGQEIGTQSVFRRGPIAVRDEAIAFLSHLTHPPTRLALGPLGGRWTAVLNNRRDGSDFEQQEFFSRFCQARTIRVVDHPSRFVVTGGRRWRKAYEAHMVTVRDEQGESVQTIICMNDGGRWGFQAYGGEPLAAEAGFDYGARRKRDRFTHENVLALLESLGVPQRFSSPSLAPTVFSSSIRRSATPSGQPRSRRRPARRSRLTTRPSASGRRR